MPKQKISKEKSIRRAKFFTGLVVSAVIVATCSYLVYDAANNTQIVSPSPYFENTQIELPTQSDVLPDPDQTIYESYSIATTEKFRGDLILVNEDNKYYGGGESLVGILEKNDLAGRDSFGSVDYTYQILDIVYEPMAQMIDDFYAATYLNDILIYGSYRSTEFQEQMYQADLANTGLDYSEKVAAPGHSEHETGYAFDFSRYDKNTGAPVDYDGTGEYEWFTDNCYKYGFVMRYPEDKSDITKITYEPWHFRYVGLPHAYYMTKNGICLEEYIDLLRSHSYADEHLEFTDDNGQDYEVYFVESNDGAETTSIPVPTGTKYEISGNNVDGFIVTVYIGKEPEPVQTTTVPETDEESDGEDTDGEDEDTDSADENNEE